MKRHLLTTVLVGCVVACGCRKHISTAASLTEAATFGDAVAVSHWLSNGSDPNRADRYGVLPLDAAVRRANNFDVIDLLIRHGAKIEIPGHYSMLVTADCTNVKQLLGLGADVNWCPSGQVTPLQSQVLVQCDPTAVRLMIKHGADLNPPGESLVATALRSNKPLVAQMLLDAGAFLGNDCGGLLLEGAARTCNFERLQMLLKAGGDVNWINEHGNSLVISALDGLNPEFLEELLVAGADPSQPNDAGETPLWLIERYIDSGGFAKAQKVKAVLVAHGVRYVTPEQILQERSRKGGAGK